MAKERQDTPTPSQDALASYKDAHGGKAPPSTKGEKLFNALDYWGLGWIANAIISIYWADAAEHTYAQPLQNRITNWCANRWPFKNADSHASILEYKQSEDLYQALKSMPEYEALHKELKATGKSLPTFFEKVGTPSEATLSQLHAGGILGAAEKSLAEEFEHLKKVRVSKYGAGKVVGFAMLNLGGWLMLAPMKLLEDRKEKIVPKLDSWLGSDKATGDAAQAIQARHEELKHEPKQTWASELLARTISTPLIVGLYYKTRAKENILAKAGIPFEGSDYYAERFATKTIAAMRRNSQEEMAIEKRLAKETAKVAARMEEKGQSHLFNQASGKKRFQNILEMGFLEVVFSAVMATLVFSWSRITGLFLGEKKQPEATGVADASVTSAAPRPEAPPLPAADLQTAPAPERMMQAPDTKVSSSGLSNDRLENNTRIRPEIAAMATHAERAHAQSDVLETTR